MPATLLRSIGDVFITPRSSSREDLLRRRLRAVVTELFPKERLSIFRAVLFQFIDKAPPAALRAMRSRMLELLRDEEQ